MPESDAGGDRAVGAAWGRLPGECHRSVSACYSLTCEDIPCHRSRLRELATDEILETSRTVSQAAMALQPHFPGRIPPSPLRQHGVMHRLVR